MPKVLEKEKKSAKSTGLVDNIEALNDLLDRVNRSFKRFIRQSKKGTRGILEVFSGRC